MNKYIYNGKAILASSKDEAIASIISEKKRMTLASASKDIVEWICKTFAGVLEVYDINADTEKKIFEKASDELQAVLLKYFKWNDDKSDLAYGAPFDPSKNLVGLLSNCISFEDFRRKIYDNALENVSEVYAHVADEVVKVLSNTLIYFNFDKSKADKLDTYIYDDVLERIVDNIDTEYDFDRYLNLQVRRSMFIPLQSPQVMLSVFKTQKLADVAKLIVDENLPDVTYDAMRTALRWESRNLDLKNFELVLLALSRVISSLYIEISDKYSYKEILSSTNSTDPHAINEFTIDQSTAYLINNGSFGFNKIIKLQNVIKVKPNVVSFFRSRL